MQMSGMIGGASFLIGIAAIFASGGSTLNMVIGDALVVAAGLSMVALGGKKPA
jgi:hypothetical protein